MAAYSKFYIFVQDLANGVHDLATNNLYIMLSDTAPTATDALYSDITEITEGNGYTTGGAQADTTSSTESSGTYSLVIQNVTWTATGGSISQFRYAVLYNENTTAKTKPLIAWFDLGSEINVTSGNSFELVMPAAIFTLT